MANIEYGLLIAILIDALLILCIAALNSKKKLNVISFIIAVILLPLLTYQISRLIGACYLSDAAKQSNAIVGVVNMFLNNHTYTPTKEDIGWFICRRCLWSTLFLVVAGVGIFITMNKRKRKTYGYDESYDGGSYIDSSYSDSKYDY